MQPIQYQHHPGVSQSQLKTLKESPRRYQAIYVTRTLCTETSDAMDFGSLVHAVVLQPHKIAEEFVCIPSSVLTSNGQRRGKAWEQFVEDNPGKHMMFAEDFDRALVIQSKVLEHPFYDLVMDWTEHVEIPIAWTDEQTGVLCKGIPDIVCKNEWVIDIKTTNDLTGFIQGKEKLTSTKIADFGYHLQGAFYLGGASACYGRQFTRFALIVVETRQPYRVYAMEIDEQSLFAGRMQVTQLLEEYQRRMKHDDWSEEGEKSLLQVSIPSWAM